MIHAASLTAACKDTKAPMLRAFCQNDVLMLCLTLLLLLLLLPLCTDTGVAALTGDPELLLKLVQSLSVEQLLVRVIESAAGSHTPAS
jgi:hypothetical protein